MPGPLLPIISRLGASLVGRSAAALAGTKAAAGAAVGKVKATALSAGTKARATLSEGSQVLTDAIKSRVGQPTPASERAKSIRKLSTPIAEQVEGKTLKEKANFLRKSDRLMNKAAAASMLNRDPSRTGLKERVDASLQQAEEGRVRQLREAAKAQAAAIDQTKKWKTGLKFALLTPALFVGFPMAIKKLNDAIEGVTRGILEKQRELTPFSGEIASAFAQLQRSDLQRKVGRAQATGTSTARLADAIGQLSRDTEEFQRVSISVLNTIAVGVARGASATAKMLEWSPLFQVMSKVAEKAEAGRLAEAAPAFQGHYEALLGRGGGVGVGGDGGGGGAAAEDKADAAANLRFGLDIAAANAQDEKMKSARNIKRWHHIELQKARSKRPGAWGDVDIPMF